MRKVSGKTVYILLFLIFWVIIALTGNWFPPMTLPENNDPIQNGAIRVLASFTFINKISIQNLTLFTFFLELLISGIIWGWRNPSEYIDMIKYLILTLGLIWFFYWQFLSRYANELFLTFEPHLFWAILTQFGVILGLGLLISTIGKVLQYQKGKKDKATQTIPSTEFECPICHTKYHSIVKYCLTCHKEIE